MYYLYILYSVMLDKYYVGFTQNLNWRLIQHNSSHKGFTSAATDWTIVYAEEYPTKKEAMKREKEIKGWKSRKMITQLVRASRQ